MRFGLALPHYDFSLPGGERISFDGMARFARMAERLEFDSAWVSDHFFLSLARYGGPPELQGSLEALTTLAGLAATTERLRLRVRVRDGWGTVRRPGGDPRSAGPTAARWPGDLPGQALPAARGVQPSAADADPASADLARSNGRGPFPAPGGAARRRLEHRVAVDARGLRRSGPAGPGGLRRGRPGPSVAATLTRDVHGCG